MIFIKLRDTDQINEKLSGNEHLVLVACQSCARASGCTGIGTVKGVAKKLKASSVEGFLMPSVCSPISHQVRAKVGDVIVSFACSAGTSNLKRIYPNNKVVEATQDVGLMVVDTERRWLRVAMPMTADLSEKNKEYEWMTGQSLPESDYMREVQE